VPSTFGLDAGASREAYHQRPRDNVGVRALRLGLRCTRCARACSGSFEAAAPLLASHQLRLSRAQRPRTEGTALACAALDHAASARARRRSDLKADVPANRRLISILRGQRLFSTRFDGTGHSTSAACITRSRVEASHRHHGLVQNILGHPAAERSTRASPGKASSLLKAGGTGQSIERCVRRSPSFLPTSDRAIRWASWCCASEVTVNSS
jgi:hypothetical protein